jgi:hypothetical protein
LVGYIFSISGLGIGIVSFTSSDLLRFSRCSSEDGSSPRYSPTTACSQAAGVPIVEANMRSCMNKSRGMTEKSYEIQVGLWYSRLMFGKYDTDTNYKINYLKAILLPPFIWSNICVSTLRVDGSFFDTMLNY